MPSIFMRFPEGKGKALTLSYDDGVRQDRRLLEIMRKHGLKGTFNINSEGYAPEGCTTGNRMSRSEALKFYRDCGMEIAVHAAHHPYLEQQLTHEFAKRMLEKGVYVVAFCYPVVPKGKDRIRTQISAGHTKEDIDLAVKAFGEVKKEMGL